MQCRFVCLSSAPPFLSGCVQVFPAKDKTAPASVKRQSFTAAARRGCCILYHSRSSSSRGAKPEAILLLGYALCRLLWSAAAANGRLAMAAGAGANGFPNPSRSSRSWRA